MEVATDEEHTPIKQDTRKGKLCFYPWLELDFKLVVDVGIIGVPNAGKSTLLSVVSAAQPAIAGYPFTTLLSNLSVVSFDYDSTMVVADLPGLLEGAHRGFGLGHEFLRHTKRCSALLEEAKLLRAQDQHEMAVNLAKYISETYKSSEVMSVYRLVGKWIGKMNLMKGNVCARKDEFDAFHVEYDVM